ncbi:MAG: ectoine synthase [Deltaproteobacteria bacterium]|nr:ectoine synthase [Deltaproteobacteria bacterium]
MIVRSVKDTEGTERDVFWGNGRSRRLLLQRDEMGFAMMETTVNAGSESHLQYRNHLEACLCISGRGEVECNGVKYPLEPGVMYALDKHDAHVLRAIETMKLISVFCPAIVGGETHDLNRPGSSY